MNTIHICSSQGFVHDALEPIDILPEKLCSIMIQGIIGIWLVKKINQSVNDSINVQNWFPVFTKDIEAYITLKVYVWVVDLVLASYLWRIVGLCNGCDDDWKLDK
jgi:hypothetical protein